MPQPESDALPGADALSGLPQFSATALTAEISTVTRAVLRGGAAVITKHQQPVMVLLSVERYVQLEQAAAPNLGALSRRFEELYARLQEPGVMDRAIGALELGAAASQTAAPAKRARRSSR